MDEFDRPTFHATPLFGDTPSVMSFAEFRAMARREGLEDEQTVRRLYRSVDAFAPTRENYALCIRAELELQRTAYRATELRRSRIGPGGRIRPSASRVPCEIDSTERDSCPTTHSID